MLGLVDPQTLKRLRTLLCFEIALSVLVIAGGAFVRASGSGAGCGEHWPLCNGQAIPWNPRLETIIEFGHRISSGLSLILFIAIYVICRRELPADHPARGWAKVSLVSFLLEAGIGAFLVLKRLVEFDTSALRAVVIALHLVNTYILLAGLLGMLWNLRVGRAIRLRELSPRSWLLWGLWGAVGATGAVVALGDTLFPAESLMHGFQQDFDSAAHFLVRLRLVHPVFAVAVGFGTFLTTAFAPSAGGTWGSAVRGLVLAQIVCGFINWLLLAPVQMQLLHLALADLAWGALVLYTLARDSKVHLTSITTDRHTLRHALS